MSRSQKPLFPLAFAILLSLAPNRSSAVDIFDTTESSGIISNFFFSPLWSATRFRTTATDFVLTSFSFQLDNTPNSMSGNLIPKIYTNDVDKPGTQLGVNLGTIDTSTISSIASMSGLNFALQPGTDYWIVFDNTGVTGSTSWRYTFTPSGISPPFAQAQTSDSGGDWQVNTGSSMIGVITAVPEPGTIVLGVIGTVVLSYAGYRRSGKSLRPGQIRKTLAPVSHQA